MDKMIIMMISCCVFSVLLSAASQLFVSGYIAENKEDNISPRRMFLEKDALIFCVIYALTGLAAGFLYFHYGYEVTEIIRNLVVMLLLIAVARIDRRKSIIPNKAVLFLLVFQIVLLCVEFFLSRDMFVENLFSSIIGLLIGLVTFLVGYFISRQGMGLGDVKLIAAMGFCLGDNSIVVIIMFSLMISAIYGIVQLVRKKKKYKDEIPFAPFLAIAATALLLLGF